MTEGTLKFFADSMADEDETTSESSKQGEGEQSDPNGQDRKDEWDLAVRFRDIQRFGYLHAKEKKEMSERAIEAVLDRGREALGPIQKPYHYEVMSQEELGPDFHAAELDIESTLEHSSFGPSGKSEPQFRIRREKDHGLVLVLDTSLSMKGEKLALLAVSVAAVSLALPMDSFAIFGFDSEIHKIKDFHEHVDAAECVRRVLSIPPGGFTNLELGLKTAIQKIHADHFPQARVILISDGRYTEGRHPVDIGKTIPFLYSVKIGKDPTGREIMKDLAMSGLGNFTEVREMANLPRVLLSGIRQWVR